MTKDRLKEEIGLFKLLMTIAMAVLTSMISWFWNNYRTASISDITIIILSAGIFSAIIFFIFIKIDHKIKELDYYD
ncbi:MAG: hypothetical protein V4612_05195 [Pseudomonadota bacterium]